MLRAWEGICLFAELQFGREKVIARGRENERIGSRFRDDGGGESRLGLWHRPARYNDSVFGLGFALEEQSLAWTGHLLAAKLGE